MKHIDIEFDVYLKHSCKRQTRESRGKKEGVRISIKSTTPVYKKFNEVMAVDENKSELFKLVATEVTSLAKDIDTTVVVTHK